jgi:pilus assembly protein Flp/PilA
MLNVYLRIRNYVEGLLREEEGQTLTEYALILVLIAIAAILAMVFLGDQISTIFSQIGSRLSWA